MKRSILAVLFLLLLSVGTRVTAEDSVTLCLYSPKLNISDFKKFKTEFDNYFVNQGQITFQPFASAKDFEKYLKENKNYLAIMSGWHFKSLVFKNSMKLLLVGCDGDKTQEQFYFVVNKTALPTKTKKIHIATALDVGFADGIISHNKCFSNTKKNIVLRVPKDIDALMSLSFNVFNVDAALVSEEVYKSYQKRYPAYAKDLQATPSGIKSAIMVVAAADETPGAVVKKAMIISSMNKDAEGRELLSLLKLDAWEKPTQDFVENAGADNEK